MKTFADMKEILKQHAGGLLTDSEAILALQCHPHQIDALLAMHRLPYKAYQKLDLADMEPDWEKEKALAVFDSGMGKTRCPARADDIDSTLEEVKPKYRGVTMLVGTGYYRTRMGQIVKLRSFRNRWFDFDSRDDDGSRPYYDISGLYSERLHELMAGFHYCDIIGRATADEYRNRPNLAEFKVEAGRCYLLCDRSMVAVVSMGGSLLSTVVFDGRIWEENGQAARHAGAISMTAAIAMEVSETEYFAASNVKKEES